MRYRDLYIQCLFSCIAMLLFLSCGGNDGDSDSDVPSEQPKLNITIFTAGHPVVTRADVGDVSGTDDEVKIHKLQVWVFEHHEGDNAADGKKVAYLEDNTPMAQLHNNTEGDILEGTYQLVVSNSFAEAKPNVDVFVLANGEQKGFPMFDGNTTREVLQGALIQRSVVENETIDPYGVTTLTIAVPSGTDGKGLPMSGRLNNAELGGQSPVLNVKTPVTVVRTVSKVRFVFSRNKRPQEEEETNKTEIRITKIELDGEMIPKEEYIFLEEPYTPRAYRVGDNYVESVTELATPGDMEIKECDTPSKYAYVSQGGQEYEDMIDLGVNGDTQNGISPELTQLGKFYFRESDKQMKGTITYEISEGIPNTEGYKVTSKEARFVMNAAGDFTRNHTWIVYGYFAGSDNLQVISVKINPWTDRDDEHEVYNW